MKIYLPWMGEFGIELIRHAPRVYADGSKDVVCFEAGKEALYPDAPRLYPVKRGEEINRKSNGSPEQHQIFKQIKHRFGKEHNYIEPLRKHRDRVRFFVPQERFSLNIEPDVVLFPRYRTNVRSKNWAGWYDLMEALQAEGLDVFSAGHRDSSFHLSCPSAWDYEHDLDATVYAIKNSKIRIGQYSALVVLSSMCGMMPWVLTMADGKMARRNDGLPDRGPNWKFLQDADHLKAGWKQLPLMEDVPGVVEEILIELKGDKKNE